MAKIGEREEFTQEVIQGTVAEAEIVLDKVRDGQKQIREILEKCPPAKARFRFRRLIESIDQGYHFGHLGRAISRAKRLERIREATEKETGAIQQAFRERRPGEKISMPFLTVAYRKVWYVLTRPESKGSQALMFALRDLYYRAKENAEQTEEKK